jgi:cAMP phosphodiesterase
MIPFEASILEKKTNNPVQGTGGGPNEDNVTGLLVRSTSTNWSDGSILGFDPGKHLAAIIRIIEEHLPKTSMQQTLGWTPSACTDVSQATLLDPETCPVANKTLSSQPPAGSGQQETDLSISPTEPAKLRRFLSTGPFASLELPYGSAKANGAYIVRSLISTYLISHPHLDHVAGLVVNTASFQETSYPKRLAALPSTIDAIKDHIFNDIIWPNLSDENNGVGLVTYVRLTEAKVNDMGARVGEGYVDLCKGLSVKCWSVSHGPCMKRDLEHVSSQTDAEELHVLRSSTIRKSRTVESNGSPRGRGENSPTLRRDKMGAYDSSAFFLRDDTTAKEILIFGDVEPDSLSLFPRTARVWAEAAEKIENHVLKGVVIECSYDDSRPDETLYGHLCPRHLISELQVLAEKVEALMKKKSNSGHKDNQTRKRKIHGTSFTRHEAPMPYPQSDMSPYKSRRRGSGSNNEDLKRPSLPPLTDVKSKPIELAGNETATVQLNDGGDGGRMMQERTRSLMPLNGLRVIIIHVKDTFQDGPGVEDTILKQLKEYEKVLQLGCDFMIPQAGSSIWL